MLRKLVTSVAIAGLVAACSSGGGGEGDVNATLQEWEFNLSASSAPAGTVTFHIQNDGEKTHEFVVVQTDTPGDELPVTDEDEVDESQFTPVDEVEDITSGSSATLTLDNLAPGHYVILCNLTGHYANGMHADFTVN
jgi:uncharacterized cupredoxin-like copper-binding protein